MLKKVNGSWWLSVGLIAGAVFYALLDGYDAAEVVNLLWILIALLFFLIPRLLYNRRYLQVLIGYIVLLLVGAINMELIIEDDGEFSDLLDIWTWTHELPGLLWPSLVVGLAKVSIDLLVGQELMITLERERAQSELKYLKSQLSPHVLFNNLNNIYSFALHQSPKTPELILRLAENMRYLLYEAQEDRVSLEHELAQLDGYIDLQLLQLEHRGEVIYEKKGDFEGQSIAPMMLVSFVENCFKHGASAEIPKITIQIESNKETLNLYTENTYSAPNDKDEASQLQFGGIGLKNVKRRLELAYSGQHELIIKQLSNRFIVNLSINMA